MTLSNEEMNEKSLLNIEKTDTSEVPSFVFVEPGRVLLGLPEGHTASILLDNGERINSVKVKSNEQTPCLLDFSDSSPEGVHKSLRTGEEWSCPNQSTIGLVFNPDFPGVQSDLIEPFCLPSTETDLHLCFGAAVHRADADILIEYQDTTNPASCKEIKLDPKFVGTLAEGDYQTINVRIPGADVPRTLRIKVYYWGQSGSTVPGVVLCSRPYLISSQQVHDVSDPLIMIADGQRPSTLHEINLPSLYSDLTLLLNEQPHLLIRKPSHNVSLTRVDGGLIAKSDGYSRYSLVINNQPNDLLRVGPEGQFLSVSDDLLNDDSTLIELRDPTGNILCAEYRGKIFSKSQIYEAPKTSAEVSRLQEAFLSKTHPDVWAIQGLFDEAFYLSGFPPEEQPEDPASHYMWAGWQQGRDPAPWFSTWHYLSMHPDVAAAGINPFMHYCTTGHREGRTLVSLGRKPNTNDDNPTVFEQLFSVTNGARSPEFAPLTSRTVEKTAGAPKSIAFYLPQFHAFPENDAWWGKGFTEWTNVSKAVPQFSGHNQPRLPGELGFYDLRLPDVIARQIELAQQFNIHGFCFHYYWFGGHRLLDKPLDIFLSQKRKEFDFPFCLCWANENWTRRWDGAEHDVLMQQTHSIDDHRAVFEDLLRYIKDPRYIKVGNRPIIVIYRPTIIDQLPEMVEIWRRRAQEEGFDDLFLIATNSFGFDAYKEIGFDALCEFPPHNVESNEISTTLSMNNRGFTGKVYSYESARDFSLTRLDEKLRSADSGSYFPSVMMSWDNEARKPGRGHVFYGASPSTFYPWMKGVLEYSMAAHDEDKRMVFVNAWNEWGEGTYLEPDRWFGYGYLNAVAASYDSIFNKPTAEISVPVKKNPEQQKKGVIFLHAFYYDLLEEISQKLDVSWIRNEFDIILTLPHEWSKKQRADAQKYLEPKRILVTPNVGRDVFPFIEALRTIELDDYEVALKIHTKKSPHLTDGSRWRSAILDALLNKKAVEQTASAFKHNHKLGLLAPDFSFMPLQNAESLRDNKKMIEYALSRYELNVPMDAKLIAGTMFWFRPQALSRLVADPLSADDFGPELGAIDGTLAHAMERLLPSFITSEGYELGRLETEGGFNPYS